MRAALLFSIAVLTVSPAIAAPPSPFWFEQMAEEAGTPDNGPSIGRRLPEEPLVCRWSAEDCAEFDLSDPEDADFVRTLNMLEDLEATTAKIDMIMFGQPRSTLTQEQLDAMDAEPDGDE